MRFASVFPSVLQLIGRTPLVELSGFDTGPCRLFAKLESQNPSGSIKDRVALSIISAAEQSGQLRAGGTIVEATAGNTGLGLAQVAALRGYRLILAIPDKMSKEKIRHLRALGADVRLTRSDVDKNHPEHYQNLARRIAEEIPDAFFADQFSNPANPLAHEIATGPEIWEQTDHKVDAVVVGVGSGGTLTGLGRYFRSVAPQTQIILADPEGSVLAPFIATGQLAQAGQWSVEGIGQDYIPDNADLSLVSRAYTISDRQSVQAARDLLLREGILAGASSGTLLAAALQYCREQTEPKNVVTLICDSGSKYLSKMFDDNWLRERHLSERAVQGNLEDLISRRHQDGAVEVTAPDENLLEAYGRMRRNAVSQLPVLDGGRLVGIIDESDILKAVEGPPEGRWSRFAAQVTSAMTPQPRVLQVDAPLSALQSFFDRDEVALIVNGADFIGLITRIDLINHLRYAGKNTRDA
ncbi:cystathionine beta-synthase [Pseudochrobactrum sp. Wa41.01b-1]|uniref:pyridoxal-phosphate dependent enzyme n=1 Tax=Pseudochrobactrum sp. Wa41.01b-1 TaxID=2864102 RepID=UPI001C68BBD9|nr:cystathionine beta-synthase [Pseudochrobactrum sp. Wa41.01b-1]QYM72194.1 cystathionine beta-synthase [Pseudochrobactrum sp. Wa41.01b-1]